MVVYHWRTQAGMKATANLLGCGPTVMCLILVLGVVLCELAFLVSTSVASTEVPGCRRKEEQRPYSEMLRNTAPSTPAAIAPPDWLISSGGDPA